ncbi:Hint domain-containing protein [Rhodobacter sp. Har01]|uniref:Hint domain-containing protein n=1 Tax=Rhodobacter sp. Har01 TaxID=2883999 RepID=UPI0029CAA250|nr:Hint domain-containing protein [Rhodobacter sp. Har01]
MRATFVISWSQTEVDGLRAGSPDGLTVGAIWRWTGQAVRIDAPGDVLLLEAPDGGTDLRRRAARMVERLIGLAIDGPQAALPRAEPDEMPDQSFVVTDGVKSHIVTLVTVRDSASWLLMFLGEVPPEGRDLWIVRTQIDRSGGAAGSRTSGGVICFAPDTLILTPDGARPVQALRPGDRVQTKDDGPQEILWTGSRRMTGARLYAMPHLRPIRFRSGVFGLGRPEGDLLVSPQHRMVVQGPAARMLFNADEVLVAAEDLVDGKGVAVDMTAREVTYHHLLLERHQIVFANGLETESFHPSATELDTVSAPDRARLLAILPGIEVDPQTYGDFARRSLSGPEAAILRHARAA